MITKELKELLKSLEEVGLLKEPIIQKEVTAILFKMVIDDCIINYMYRIEEQPNNFSQQLISILAAIDGNSEVIILELVKMKDDLGLSETDINKLVDKAKKDIETFTAKLSLYLLDIK